MKKIAFITALILLLTVLCACAPDGGAVGGNNYTPTENEMYARFMTNAGNESVQLSGDRGALGDNLLFASYKITAGQKLTKPEGQPTKNGFKFAGWAVDREGSKLWDFDTAADGGVTLFAKWERDESEKKEEYVEPVISFTEKKDESTPISIKGVLTSAVTGGTVELTAAGIGILTENAQNVKEYIDYTVNSSTSIKSAVYDQKKITVTYNDGEDKQIVINVTDVTATLAVDNSTYESKAAKYEDKVHIAAHSVIMAGSSSMENWTNSVVDMAPVTTANVGIGGTTVEQWSEKLSKRLIYPYDPRAVILYVGINNIINSKKSGQETGNALITLFDDIHAHLPNAQIYFILINKVPGYTTYYGDIDIANGTVMSYAGAKDYMTLIDAGRGLIKQSGKTNSAYFLTDGLHMSLCGYVIWGKAVKDAFIAKEKELYK